MAQYANVPFMGTARGAGSRALNHKSNGGQIFSKGRGQPCTPQQLIVLQAITEKTERARRAMTAGRDPNKLYADAATNDRDFNVFKGQLGICNPNPTDTFRGALTADTNVRVHTNMAGLSRDEKLGMPVVIQVSRDADNADSEDRTTIVPAGMQTVVATGGEPLACGQKVYFDPNPYVVKDANGKDIPGVVIPGIPETVMHGQIRPLLTTTLHTSVVYTRELVRKRMKSNDAFQAKLQEHLLNPKKNSDVLLMRQFQEVCKSVYDDLVFGEELPIRELVLLWAVWFVSQLVWLDQLRLGGKPLEGTSKMCASVTLMRTLRQVMLQMEHVHARTYSIYESQLPHTLDVKLPGNSLGSTSVDSQQLRDAMDTLFEATAPSGTDTRTSALDLLMLYMKTHARLELHHAHYSELAMHAQRGYIARFIIGTCLSGAGKGQPVDILFGR